MEITKLNDELKRSTSFASPDRTNSYAAKAEVPEPVLTHEALNAFAESHHSESEAGFNVTRNPQNRIAESEIISNDNASLRSDDPLTTNNAVRRAFDHHDEQKKNEIDKYFEESKKGKLIEKEEIKYESSLMSLSVLDNII